MRVKALILAVFVAATATAAPIRHTTQANLKQKRTAAHHTTDGIDPERATQIQTALIKAGYLSGTPSGNWDADSIAAMQKLQNDQGWQTKIVPDARALIFLGLGPHPDTPTTPPTPQQ